MAQIEVPQEKKRRRKLPDQGSQILIGHWATRGEVDRTHGVRSAKGKTNGNRMERGEKRNRRTRNGGVHQYRRTPPVMRTKNRRSEGAIASGSGAETAAQDQFLKADASG